jgi:hypothetical protein
LNALTVEKPVPVTRTARLLPALTVPFLRSQTLRQ